MSLLPAEKVKIDNYQAQYNSILSNITIANRELETALSTAENATKEANILRLTISNESLKLDEIRIESIKIKREQSNKENILNDREDVVFKKECGLNERLHELELEEDRVRQVTLDEISERNTLLKILDKSISDKEEKSIAFSIAIKTLNGTLAAKEEEIQSLTDLSEAIKADLSETMEAHDNKLDKAQLKLAKILKTIEEESIRVGVPSEKLHIREKALTVREADAKVIVKRLTRVYEELYPDRILKI